MENGHDIYGVKLPKVTRKWGDVVTAFKEGRELRTRTVGDSGWSGWNLRDRAGIRDMVRKDHERLVYYLWGSEIAVIEDGVLTLDNCRYATQLTGKRLLRILHECTYDVEVFLGADGWRPGWDMKPEPYPLKISLRTREVLSRIDLDKQYRHLGRMREPHKIQRTHDSLKRYGPVPAAVEDKVLRKLMVARLTEAA